MFPKHIFYPLNVPEFGIDGAYGATFQCNLCIMSMKATVSMSLSNYYFLLTIGAECFIKNFTDNYGCHCNSHFMAQICWHLQCKTV